MKNSNHHNSRHHSEDEHHDHQNHHAMMLEDFKKRFWISLALTIPIMAMAPMIQGFFGISWSFPGMDYIRFGLSTIVFFYGGWPFLTGLVDEVKQKQPGMMTLIALAIVVAYGYSSLVIFFIEGKTFFWELSSLIAIMLLGHWLEMRSVMGASGALEELASLIPDEAHLIRDEGETEDIKVSDLEKGQVVLVKPGEKIPVDGKVTDGESHVNESMITGESTPVAKKKGDDVIGGSINSQGTLKVEITHTGEDAYLNKVVDMVKSAQQSKSKTQNYADKAAGYLFYFALGAGIITIIVWLLTGHQFDYALERMVTVMVISCPHALGLAIPLVVAISTAISAKNGLLIRNRTAFEQARKINLLIFDKTGTLTKGEFGVTGYASTANAHDDDILKIAASLEQSSEHPLAAGILKKAREKELKLEEVSDFETITGKGIRAKIDQTEYYLVGPGFLEENTINKPDDIESEGPVTTVFLVKDKKVEGYLQLSDEIRETSKEAIKTLHDNGIEVMMATGDNEKVAKAVSKELGLDNYKANVLPEDKKSIVEKAQDEGKFVAMTGDGINDAPALAQADVGIAVGSGTDVAAETADIVLVESDPKDITNLILFGKATYKKMQQNLIWAAGYNIVAVPLAAGVLAPAGILLSPAVGAILMSLSTVIVAINAQHLKTKMK